MVHRVASLEWLLCLAAKAYIVEEGICSEAPLPLLPAPPGGNHHSVKQAGGMQLGDVLLVRVSTVR